MQEDIKREWIDRLRSGKYHQGIGALRQSRGDIVTHCCLGVLCEMAREASITSVVNNVLKPGTGIHITVFGGFMSYYEDALAQYATPSHFKTMSMLVPEYADTTASYLPQAVAKWAGLTNEKQHELARLNDQLTPFDAIADHIKNHI